jgi:hypothetical protein
MSKLDSKIHWIRWEKKGFAKSDGGVSFCD